MALTLNPNPVPLNPTAPPSLPSPLLRLACRPYKTARMDHLENLSLVLTP